MKVEVLGRKFAVPFECPCCGATPDAELYVVRARAGAKGGARGLDVPYCRRCIAHVEIWESAGLLSSAVMVSALFVASIVAVMARPWIGLVVFVVAIALAVVLAKLRRGRAQAARGESCASTGIALGYLGVAGGATTLSFESPTYTARFAEQNAGTVRTTPQLQRLLEGYKQARLAVPTPAAAVGVVPPPLTSREWIARIESTQGRFGRRAALMRALEVVQDPADRRELVAIAAQLELAPVIDKLGRVRGAEAIAVVEQAVAELRLDNVPDELEDAAVRQLEARIGKT